MGLAALGVEREPCYCPERSEGEVFRLNAVTCLLPPADKTAQCEAYCQTISSLQAQLRAAGMSPCWGEPSPPCRLQGCSGDPLLGSPRAVGWKGQSLWPECWECCSCSPGICLEDAAEDNSGIWERD